MKSISPRIAVPGVPVLAAPQLSSFRRWLVLAAIVLNVAFNYVSEVFLPLEPMRVISDRYETSFTPAPYTFSIWGLIYGALLVYAVVQLQPSRRNDRFYDGLAYPLIAANILATVWILLFRAEYVGAALVTIFVMLILAGHLFWTASHIVERGQATRLLTIPFAMFFGWLTVAAFANLGAYGVFMGGEGSPAAAPPTAIVFMAIALIATGLVVLRTQDAVFPATIAWAALGIAVEQRALAGVASFVAATSATFCIYALYVQYKQRRAAHHDPTRTSSAHPAHRRRLESYT